MKLVSISNHVARRVFISILAASALAVGLPQSAFAQSDPMIGTWKLNLAKSTFSPGPPPRSSTLTIAEVGQGQTATFDGISAAGMPTHTVFTVINDGHPHPVTGSPVVDASSGRRINAYRTDYSLLKAGKELQTGAVILSTDGKTATFMNTGANADGQPLSNVAVYEKQ